MRAAKWIAAGVGIVAMGAVAGYAQYRDIEEPAYTIVKTDESFELRDYPALVVAEVTSPGDSRRQSSNRSFRRLAAYIFGQDRPAGGDKIAMTAPVMMDRVDQNEKIAMTAPVLQEQDGDGAWRMRFVMPTKYSLETLPEAPSDITLTEMPARRLAAVRFSGWGGDPDLVKMERALREWIAAEGLTPASEVEYAFYDAPMVPGPLRRNEVLIEVAVD
ncbi:MAG: heme-binding protein [Pseudomonadota bacterium]